MYRSSRFGELLEALPKAPFKRLVEEYESDKYCKGYDSWSHLVSMIFVQLTGVRSLRELQTAFNVQAHHHYHLGVDQMKRSTLSDANANRDCAVFEAMCSELLSSAHRKVRRDLKKQLYLLDSTPIPLKGLGYEWTKGNSTQRVQGLSVHIVIAPDPQVPVDARITYSNVNDVVVGKEMIKPEKGATYVFDKGYYDYSWWFKLHEAGSFFVTRLKKNAGVRVVKERKIKEADRGMILEDTTIEFNHATSSTNHTRNAYFGKTLRRIVIARPGKDKPIVLVTNDKKRTARQIGALYKQRWDIELFFKWMKQNLKIKQFLGRTENAVKIQIYCALIAYLLASEYRRNRSPHCTLKEVLTLFRHDIFSRPEINESEYRKRKEERDKISRVQRELAF